MHTSEIQSKESEIVDSIVSISEPNGNIAIVGGHYILLFEKLSGALKPTVYEDLEIGPNKTFAQTRAKNFPVKSFSLSVNLFEYYIQMKENVKFVMVVNDDAFQRKNFRSEEHFEIVKDRGYELRHNYYNKSLEESLPKSFLNILDKKKWLPKDVFQNFTYQTSSKSYMPESSYFISERKLCKRFRGKTAKELLKTGSDFFSTPDVISHEVDNLSVKSDSESVCLIEDGVCDCGGKAYQFYLDLVNVGFRMIIFFVPNDCSYLVNRGAELFLKSTLAQKLNIQIINIYNVESDPENEIVDKTLNLKYFKT
jgi:hypothetical protein